VSNDKAVPIKASSEDLSQAGQDPKLGAMKRAAVRAGRATGNSSLRKWGMDLIKPPPKPDLGSLGKQKPTVPLKQ